MAMGVPPASRTQPAIVASSISSPKFAAPYQPASTTRMGDIRVIEEWEWPLQPCTSGRTL